VSKNGKMKAQLALQPSKSTLS